MQSKKFCHNLEEYHDKVNCFERCETILYCGHKCLKRCFQNCECQENV